MTVEQGYEAARQTGLNCLAGIRYAVGSLDRVRCLVRNLCFVAAAPDFTDVHLVSSGCSDLLRDVFGPEAGLGGRATIGVQSLAHDHCFECWLEVELDEPTMPERGSPTSAGRHAIATPHAAASAAGDAIFRARRHRVRRRPRGCRGADGLLPAHVRRRRRHHRAGGDARRRRARRERLGRGAGGRVCRRAGRREFGRCRCAGAHSVTVPGAVAAWETLRELGGTLRFADLLEPAAKMAEEGVAVTPSLAKSLADEERRGDLEADEGMNEVFRPGGRAARGRRHRSCSRRWRGRCGRSRRTAPTRSTAARSGPRSRPG